MSYDSIASLQRIQQLQQAEAAAGNRLILRRVDSVNDIVFGIAAFILMIPTLTISLIIFGIYWTIKEKRTKTYLVKNVATGEKFMVRKEEFKEYQKMMKNKEKEVRSIKQELK